MPQLPRPLKGVSVRQVVEIEQRSFSASVRLLLYLNNALFVDLLSHETRAAGKKPGVELIGVVFACTAISAAELKFPVQCGDFVGILLGPPGLTICDTKRDNDR